MAIKTKIQVD